MDEPPDHDDLDHALATARQQFIADFSARCAALQELIDSAAPDAATIDRLVQLAHRTAGVGGMVGFSDVSARAAALEDIARDSMTHGFDRAAAAAALAELKRAFSNEAADAAHPHEPDSAP